MQGFLKGLEDNITCLNTQMHELEAEYEKERHNRDKVSFFFLFLFFCINSHEWED